MKKVLATALVCCLTWGGAQAQTMDEARRLYSDGALQPCAAVLNRLPDSALTPDERAEKALMMAFIQHKGNTSATLSSYISSYPDTPQRLRVAAMLAEELYAAGDYAGVTGLMNDMDVEKLPPAEMERMLLTYGMALAGLGETDEARVQLRTVKALGGDEANEAIWQLALLDYAEGYYAEALSGFSQVESEPQYHVDALCFEAQTALEMGSAEDALSIAEKVMAEGEVQPSSLLEAKRVRGEALYALGHAAQSAEQLEEYLAAADEPRRQSLYALGMAHYASGNYLRAPEVLSMVGVADGTLTDAMAQSAELYSGLSYLKTGDNDRARMSFEHASAMTADVALREQAMYNYIAALHDTGYSAFGEGVTAAERFLNEFPSSGWADKVGDFLVETYNSTRNYTSALQSIARIEHPGKGILTAKQQLLCRSGQEAYAGGRMDDAAAQFAEAIALGKLDAGTYAEALLWRGETSYRKGNMAAAKNDYTAALNAAPKRGGRTWLLADYGLGYCNFRQGNYNEAYRRFEAFATATDAVSLTDRAAVADAYGRMGDCYFQARRYSDAEGAYDHAIATDPSTSAYSVYQKAFSQGLQGRYQDKIATLTRLVADYPTSDYADDALFEKGRSYVQLENGTQALAAFRDLLARYPRSAYAPAAGNEVALLCYQAGNTDEAIKAYKEVIVTYPGSDEALVAMRDLKSLYVERNQVDSYVDFASQTHGTVVVDATEHDSLSYAAAEQAYMRGDTQKARQAFDGYLQQFPNGAYMLSAHYHLGCIYKQQNDYAQAQQHLQEVSSRGSGKYWEEATRMVADLAYDHGDYAKAINAYRDLKSATGSTDTRLHASTYMVRAAYALSDWDTVSDEVGMFIDDKSLTPQTATEMRYYRAKAYLAKKQNDAAATDLKELAKDTRTVYGAEAKYLLAQLYYDTGQSAKAEKEVLNYISVSTPHSYWLARSFILLADVYTASGRQVEAKQYLLSLRQNYTADDDIAGMISSRLARLQ